MTNISKKALLVNRTHEILNSLQNFYTFNGYDRWASCEGVISFARTSPRLLQSKYSHDVQRNELRSEIFKRTGKEPEFHIDEIGVSGHRINVRDRRGLANAAAVAFQNHFPIVCWDWTRLTRKPELLLKLDRWGVDFVCLQPLTVPLDELHRLRVQKALEEKHRQEQLGSGNQELGRFLSRYMDFKPL